MTMIPPHMEPDAPELHRLLSRKQGSLLMLDYDGTLAPFREEREKAFPYPGVHAALRDLTRNPFTLSKRVVIVSGRPISDLTLLLDLDPLPEIWGSHGWERRLPDGSYRVGPFDEAAIRGLANADEWAIQQGMDARCERKPGSLALHWRGLAEERKRHVKARALKGWDPIAQRFHLEIRTFDGGIEIRVPGRTKGDAVVTLLSESPDNTAAAYLGDDTTDEDAFEALGDRGLSVLVRPAPRISCAQVWIRPPEELINFLNAWNSFAPVCA